MQMDLFGSSFNPVGFLSFEFCMSLMFEQEPGEPLRQCAEQGVAGNV